MGIDGCGQSNGPVGLFLDGHAQPFGADHVDMRWRAPQQCDIGDSPGQHSGIERAESPLTDKRNTHGRASLFYVIDHSCTINEVHSYTIMHICRSKKRSVSKNVDVRDDLEGGRVLKNYIAY